MKKTIRIISMLLVILMLAGSFSGCFTAWAFKEGGQAIWLLLPIPFLPALDLISSPIQLTIFIVELVNYNKTKEKIKKSDGIDTFSLAKGSFSEAELLSLTEKLNSLPETEKNAFTDKISSFSQMETKALVQAFNDLSDDEVSSSIGIISSMPDETLIAALNNFQNIKFRFKYE